MWRIYNKVQTTCIILKEEAKLDLIKKQKNKQTKTHF